jgi:hypothetical protein
MVLLMPLAIAEEVALFVFLWAWSGSGRRKAASSVVKMGSGCGEIIASINKTACRGFAIR